MLTRLVVVEPLGMIRGTQSVRSDLASLCHWERLELGLTQCMEEGSFANTYSWIIFQGNWLM